MPSWVAMATLKELDPKNLTPVRVGQAALEQFKGMAARRLRGKFEPLNDKDALQHDLFPDLQRRYPIKRNSKQDEPIYADLEDLSDEDIEWNVHRLASESKTKMAHSKALAQYGRDRNARTKRRAA